MYDYGQDAHGSVATLNKDGNTSGAATAVYSYTPYGQEDDQADQPRSLSKGDVLQSGTAVNGTTRNDNPLNPYRYTAKRYDTGSQTLDTGARRLDPGSGRFLQPDLFRGALDDLGLATDPLTQNRYALAAANPIGYIESDGHRPICDGGECPSSVIQSWQQAQTRAAALNTGHGCWGAGGEWQCGAQTSGGGSTPTRPVTIDPNKVYIDVPNNTGKYDPTLCKEMGGMAAGAPATVCLSHGPELLSLYLANKENQKMCSQSLGLCSPEIAGCLGKHSAASCIEGAVDIGLLVCTVSTDGICGLARFTKVATVGKLDIAAEEAASAAAGGDEVFDAATSCLNSFTGDTPVALADGSSKPIKDVKVGDKVRATDPTTGRTKAEPVVELVRHSGEHPMVLLTLANGSVLDSTSGHPIWDATAGSFTDANHLRVGDNVEAETGTLLTITALTEYTASLTAYNLQVEQIHTYYAGATPVLVHNSCGPNYHPRVRARGLEDPTAHNFPYSFDQTILKSTPTTQSDGSLLYRVPGVMNGRDGVYEIGLNPDTNTIFHRVFRKYR
jgi:RHS repeat-associated protein